jgi:acetyl esterase/lipase
MLSKWFVGVSVVISINYAFASPVNERGHLIRQESLGFQTVKSIEVTKRALKITSAAARVKKLEYIRLVYSTIDTELKPVQASGILVIPHFEKGSHSPLSLVSYQHGTAMNRKLVPSVDAAYPETVMGALLFGSQGFAVVEADYLGLGDSPGFHPYLHAHSEATASADAIRAARTVLEARGLTLSHRLYLTGASQGGHATLALHRFIENEEPGDWIVAASAPISGPYDLSKTCLQFFLNQGSTVNVIYAAYLFSSMNQVYHLYPNIKIAIQLPGLSELFGGDHSMDQAMKKFPEEAKNYFQKEFRDALLTPEGTSAIALPMLKALGENNVYDWKPKCKVRLYHAQSDEIVPFKNSEVAYHKMKDLGVDVELKDMGDMKHVAGSFEALKLAAIWFDELENQALALQAQ